jgi:ketosteroid isomerase-like protein
MAPAQESSVALVQRLYDAWAAGDTETALAGIDPDIEWIEPADNPDGEARRGPEGVLASMAQWTQPFEDYGYEIVERTDLGAQALFGLVQRGRGRASGVQVESRIWHLWTVKDRRAARLEMFMDRDAALAAAGVE